MNALDMLKYGHQTLLDTIKDLADDDWAKPGICGNWSTKDILAHLASYEVILVEVLDSIVNPNAPTPNLHQFLETYETYNDTAVEARHTATATTILNDYTTAYTKASDLLAQIPIEKRRENGILPWYGAEYDLEDFIVYMYYAHKREHSAQIGVYRDQLARLRAL
jgi:uncharacterized damage-inducible protein DinB